MKFNGSIRLEEREERLTTEAGALLLREVDERLGLSRWLSEQLKEPRDAARITHPLEELVRTHLLLLGQGWRDQDDAAPRHTPYARSMRLTSRRGALPPGPSSLFLLPLLFPLLAVRARYPGRHALLLCRVMWPSRPRTARGGDASHVPVVRLRAELLQREAAPLLHADERTAWHPPHMWTACPEELERGGWLWQPSRPHGLRGWG